MRILVLPGDGIGPEITAATTDVLRAVDARLGLGLEFDERAIGFRALETAGSTLPDEVMARAREVDGIILGPISHLDYPPRAQGGINISAAMRVQLDLFANIRPARTRTGVLHRGSEMDLVIVRECTEGFYSDRNMVAGTGEFMPTRDVALSVRKITREACRRIAETAFTLAARRRRRVTVVHKANCFHLTDGLWLEEVRAVGARHSQVVLDEEIVDAMAAKLVRDASGFDVICTTNFHGDILSDLASELSGSLGLAGAINAGHDQVCAQAQHGSAPDIAGLDKANPSSLILSAAMMLDWLGDRHDWPRGKQAAALIETVLDDALEHSATRTADVGGVLGTGDFTARMVDLIERRALEPREHLPE